MKKKLLLIEIMTAAIVLMVGIAKEQPAPWYVGFLSIVFIVLTGTALFKFTDEEQSEEITQLHIEFSKYKNGLGELEWNDNRTEQKRLLMYFGLKKYNALVKNGFIDKEGNWLK